MTEISENTIGHKNLMRQLTLVEELQKKAVIPCAYIKCDDCIIRICKIERSL